MSLAQNMPSLSVMIPGSNGSLLCVRKLFYKSIYTTEYLDSSTKEMDGLEVSWIANKLSSSGDFA